MKAKGICCHWICTTRNAKRNSLVQKEMTAFGNADLQEEMKNTKKANEAPLNLFFLLIHLKDI